MGSLPIAGSEDRCISSPYGFDCQMGFGAVSRSSGVFPSFSIFRMVSLDLIFFCDDALKTTALFFKMSPES